ncbi:MAG: hypothetical protein MK183_03515 [Verrucomicrobiales bacterium]|nr:hypothetical protein [Verrucomicrobiales bacterium]
MRIVALEYRGFLTLKICQLANRLKNLSQVDCYYSIPGGKGDYAFRMTFPDR